MKLTLFRVRILLGVFFLLVAYEVATDGISSALSFIPPAQWSNFAGDTVLNVLQILIFSVVSTAVGARYVHRGYTRSTRSDFGEYPQSLSSNQIGRGNGSSGRYNNSGTRRPKR